MQSESLRYLAFIFMVIDHVTLLYFPGFVWGRIVGRWSAPIFFYLLASGYRNTRSPRQYFLRLLSWGIVSEVVLWLLGLTLSLNILLTLAWCLMTLVAIHQAKPMVKLWVALVCMFGASLVGLDYGWYAVIVSVLFTLYTPSQKWWWGLWIFVNVLASWLIYPLQIFAFPVPFLISAFEGQTLDLPRLRWVWYLFYPLHWVVLCTLPLL
ncbi:MAG: TraX family protein [Limnoraphis robusta]|uniref:TraX family protein n=1 Tax=Limnoraphis robusta TaxID=1118279 RepID=UPI00066B239C|nr:TraX family protein [Limnoraphis robusta]